MMDTSAVRGRPSPAAAAAAAAGEGGVRLVSMLGSLRRDSFNAMVQRALPELVPAGVTIEPLGCVGDLPIYDADIDAAGMPAAVTAMAAAIAGADGVVLVTPEYNYSMPGGLKNALDWMSRCSPQPFAGKPVAIQTASPGSLGGARCQYQLRQVFVFLDAIVLNKPEVMIAGVTDKVDQGTRRLTDEATRGFVAAQLGAIAERARAVRRERALAQAG